MRIISGKLKRRSIFSSTNMSIRPTTDRHRESLFNILSNMNVIMHAKVLDLYAGTGALGIESLSRGAQSIVFVDYASEAIQLIKKNIKLLKINDVTKVIQKDILKDLTYLNDNIFDLILMDPPYQYNYIEKTLSHIANQQFLNSNTLIVAEHAANESMHVPAIFQRFDSRQYGKTKFSFFQLRN